MQAVYFILITVENILSFLLLAAVLISVRHTARSQMRTMGINHDKLIRIRSILLAAFFYVIATFVFIAFSYALFI